MALWFTGSVVQWLAGGQLSGDRAKLAAKASLPLQIAQFTTSATTTRTATVQHIKHIMRQYIRVQVLSFRHQTTIGVQWEWQVA